MQVILPKDMMSNETSGLADDHEVMMDPGKMMEKLKMEDGSMSDMDLGRQLDKDKMAEEPGKMTGHMEEEMMKKPGMNEDGQMDQGHLEKAMKPMEEKSRMMMSGQQESGQVDQQQQQQLEKENLKLKMKLMEETELKDGPMASGHSMNGQFENGQMNKNMSQEMTTELAQEAKAEKATSKVKAKASDEMSEDERLEKLENFEKSLVRKIKLSERNPGEERRTGKSGSDLETGIEKLNEVRIIPTAFRHFCNSLITLCPCLAA